MDYDVMVIGAGIVGCAVAYELSKYNLNITVVEKGYDVAHNVSQTNTSVVYDGIKCDDDMTAKLERMGNKMMPQIASKFKIPYKQTGGLIVASTDKEEEELVRLYERSKQRGITGIKHLNKDYVEVMEPNLKGIVKSAIYNPYVGVIEPYTLALAYAETAFDNNVNFRLEEEVNTIRKIGRGYRVATTKNKFSVRMVINTTDNRYEIDSELPVKLKPTTKSFFELSSRVKPEFNNVIMNLGEEGSKTIYESSRGKVIASLIGKRVLNEADMIGSFKNIVDDIKIKDVRAFYGNMDLEEGIFIDDSDIDAGYIRVVGKHYALVTVAPAIADMVTETVTNNLGCKLKKNFVDKARGYTRFIELSDDEKSELIKLDKRYGKVVCKCNHITEAELVEAIRRPLGARTIAGVKRRTNALSGVCYGSECLDKAIFILAKEMNKSIYDIDKDSKGSKVLTSRVKEFNSI